MICFGNPQMDYSSLAVEYYKDLSFLLCMSVGGGVPKLDVRDNIRYNIQ